MTQNTFLRSQESHERYEDYKKNYHGDGTDHFADWRERLVTEYEHWAIIENYFPYDKIAQVSHLLITKRVVTFDWDLLTQEEKDELVMIKKDISQKYSFLIENLPSIQTAPKHFHLHILRF